MSLRQQNQQKNVLFVVKKRFFIGLFFVFFATFYLQGQSVLFRCTQVNNDGDIVLSWKPTSLSSDYHYEIYASRTRNGQYDSIATTTQNTYSHLGANGGMLQWFYFIKAVSSNNSDPIVFSDTIGSLLMVLSNPGNGIISLFWTPINTQNSSTYDILRARHDSWDLWARTDTTFFIDTITVCGENLAYQISVTDNSGCQSTSIAQNDFFTDFIAPEIPILDSISLNPSNGQIELGWEKSKSKDIFGYIVYIFQDGIWNVVDTVYGGDNTHYIDRTNKADSVILEYRICAIDTCRNASPLGDVHHTLLPTAIPYKCDSMVTLSWNAYTNMPDGVSSYLIFVAENNGQFLLIDSVKGNTTTYSHRKMNPQSSYAYYVVAYNANKHIFASSAKVQVQFNRTIGHGDLLLRYVSVINNKDVEIAVFVEDSIDYKNIFLYRSPNKIIPFDKWTTAPKSGTKNYVFIDTNIEVATETYYYFATLTDECDVIFAYSDTANNIVLQENASAADKVNVQWNQYEGFAFGMDNYTLWREDQTKNKQIVSVNTPTTFAYEDDVWDFASTGAKFYYQIEAIESKNNPFGFQDKSYSNILEIAKETEIFIPNAFHPNGEILENQIFKPIFSYLNNQNYQFLIYNRWGEVVFSTNDINEGWDGTSKGRIAHAGVYIYLLIYQNKEGNIVQKRGYVTLIR